MNRKLKLSLDELAVDPFDTTRAERPKGTVFGEQCTCYTVCTCPGCPTCDATCAEELTECGNSCGGAATCYQTCNTCPATCAYSCDDYTCIAKHCQESIQMTNCPNVCW
jgi:hypothetical protein